jgi:muconolactone delta-isomerase
MHWAFSPDEGERWVLMWVVWRDDGDPAPFGKCAKTCSACHDMLAVEEKSPAVLKTLGLEQMPR